MIHSIITVIVAQTRIGSLIKTVICARYYVFSCLAGHSAQCEGRGRIGPLLPACVRKWARLGQNSPRPPSAQYDHPSAHPANPRINRPTSHISS